MQELSMNILDIAENSVRAGARLVEISLVEDTRQNTLTLTVADDGKGMDAAMVASVTDPFTTTRTTRKVGLGLPFLKMAARQTGGDLSIASVVGKGTTVTATFTPGHIDLMPLGDMGGTFAALAGAGDGIDFAFRYAKDAEAFTLDTREVREVLGEDVSLAAPEIQVWLRDAVNEGIGEVNNS